MKITQAPVEYQPITVELTTAAEVEAFVTIADLVLAADEDDGELFALAPAQKRLLIEVANAFTNLELKY